MKKFISVCLVVLFAVYLSACGLEDNISNNSHNSESAVDQSQNSDTSTGDSSSANDFSKTDEDMFTNRDKRTEYEESESIKIQLNGTSATADDSGVEISGTTITITKEATYVISGTLNNGMVIVDAPDDAKLQLVMNGAIISNEESAALYILEADKVFLTLADNTENKLSNGGTFTAIDENDIDAALFSKQDLTINGNGTLTIESPAGHGIVSKDDLVITGGNYIVKSASHGLDANDSVRITGNTDLNIDSGKDGIHAENNDDESLGFVYVSNGVLKIESEGDGISSGAYTQINGGSFNILAGGGYENGTQSSSGNYGDFMGGGMSPGGHRPWNTTSTTSDASSTSMKGIKSGTDMSISGGEFIIDSADDALHSNVSLFIKGGVFNISSGDDAIHAEEELNVSDCNIDIAQSYEGLEALNIKIYGGNIKLKASDDGLNAAGGVDSSGSGGRDEMFGRPGGHGGPGGGMSANSNGSILISGGTLYVNASGDGIDANGKVEITGGHTTVLGPTQGDTSTLDYDISATISGGTFIGTGAAGMAQTFSESSQGIISLNVGNQSAGTEISLTNNNGEVIVSHFPELSFQIVIISTPNMVKGETYTISIGGNTDSFTAN